jgi:hypothetical protein
MQLRGNGRWLLGLPGGRLLRRGARGVVGNLNLAGPQATPNELPAHRLGLPALTFVFECGHAILLGISVSAIKMANLTPGGVKR